MQFRLLAAQYARKDTFAERKLAGRTAGNCSGRRSALREAAGWSRRSRQDLPRFPSPISKRRSARCGGCRRDFSALYFRVKIAGLHFCGAAYYNVPLVEGFHSLALIYPVTLWIARWLAASDARQRLEVADISRALAVADHHHGYSPAFGQRTFRGRVRLLARLDDIARLIAWYSR